LGYRGFTGVGEVEELRIHDRFGGSCVDAVRLHQLGDCGWPVNGGHYDVEDLVRMPEVDVGDGREHIDTYGQPTGVTHEASGGSIADCAAPMRDIGSF
jgi:hypothetical protein